MLHSALGDSRLWKRQVEALSLEHEVVTPDLPGWGETPLPTEPFSFVDAVAEHLPAALVGNSFGGAVALAYALAHQDKVSKLALVAPGFPTWDWTEEMKNYWAAEEAAIDAGDLDAAKRDYAAARPFYEHIESDVDGFVKQGFSATDNKGNLDYLVDMRQSNLDDAVGWSGFHAVEKDLFQAGAITATTKQTAADLTSNVQLLAKLVPTLKYKPEDLANGAAGLLEEVQSNKITGEEEAYSHIDLVDLAANVEGARQAFAYLKTGLTKVDPALTKQIAAQFDATNTMMDGFRDANALGGFSTWDDAAKAKDANRISQQVQALQDPLSRLAEKVATA